MWEHDAAQSKVRVGTQWKGVIGRCTNEAWERTKYLVRVSAFEICQTFVAW